MDNSMTTATNAGRGQSSGRSRHRVTSAICLTALGLGALVATGPVEAAPALPAQVTPAPARVRPRTALRNAVTNIGGVINIAPGNLRPDRRARDPPQRHASSVAVDPGQHDPSLHRHRQHPPAGCSKSGRRASSSTASRSPAATKPDRRRRWRHRDRERRLTHPQPVVGHRQPRRHRRRRLQRRHAHPRRLDDLGQYGIDQGRRTAQRGHRDRHQLHHRGQPGTARRGHHQLQHDQRGPHHDRPQRQHVQLRRGVCSSTAARSTSGTRSSATTC